MKIASSELILNADGSVYHLNLLPEQIAMDIITVGDPDRVDRVASHFDRIDHVVHKREFKTITGKYKNKPISVISTGIGTDNIDIVFNELDALVNVNLHTREIKPSHTQLKIYRIGTSGAIRSEIDIDTVIISGYAIGLESLMNYYDIQHTPEEKALMKAATSLLSADLPNVSPYASTGSLDLINIYKQLGTIGITTTATGFYGPQGRNIRLKAKSIDFVDKLSTLEHQGLHATNLEMETAGIYGLAQALGHQAISLNAILANRANGTFSQQPGVTVDQLINDFLQIWAND